MKLSVYLLCLLLTSILFLSACTDRPSAEDLREETENIKQVAMFRDYQSNRLVTFEVAEGTSVEEIRAHAESLSHVKDRLLGAFYFEAGTRGLAPNQIRGPTIMNAVDIVYDAPDTDPWRYAFMRPFVGEPRFADCLETPQDGLCRR